MTSIFPYMRAARHAAVAALLMTLAGLTTASSAGGSVPGEGRVVVNEFTPSGLFGLSTDESVELHNASEESVPLAGWQLHACLSPSIEELVKVFGTNDVIGPGEFLWLAHVDHAPAFDSPPPDGRYSIDVPEDGGWLLSDPFSGYADAVGLSSGLDCTEGDPALQCDWVAGAAVTRDEQGNDTDDNAADSTCQPRTPGR